jgi:hypothetical protein
MVSSSSVSAGKGTKAGTPVRPRVPSQSPEKGDEEVSAALSAKLGDMVLTEKEATGLVIKDLVASSIPKPKWVIVGKACSPCRLIISALERAMQRAWGLHRPANFKDIRENRFVVRFGSEGDFNHVMRNGLWQFDFNALLIEEYDGKVRPTDMVFEHLDVWVRVLNLPLDMMNRAYGELFGNWIGKILAVDVDEDGTAWGKELRIWVRIRIDRPLDRGVIMKETGEEDDDGFEA